jgi:hypothetical protein
MIIVGTIPSKEREGNMRTRLISITAAIGGRVLSSGMNSGGIMCIMTTRVAAVSKTHKRALRLVCLSAILPPAK